MLNGLGFVDLFEEEHARVWVEEVEENHYLERSIRTKPLGSTVQLQTLKTLILMAFFTISSNKNEALVN